MPLLQLSCYMAACISVLLDGQSTICRSEALALDIDAFGMLCVGWVEATTSFETLYDHKVSTTITPHRRKQLVTKNSAQ